MSDQITTLQLDCDRYNWPVVGVFEDVDRSASRHRKRERPEFEALIAAIDSGKARIVAAFEASRYARDLEVYLRIRNACAENGVLFYYNGTLYDLSKREDRKATAQDALQAEDEAEQIRDRNLRTVRRSVEKGLPHGRIPEGYAREYNPSTGELIRQVESPTQADNVREIFRRFDSGEGMLAIVRDLERREALNQHGKPYSLFHLSHILRNRAYIGRRVWHGRDVGEGQWPALVDEATFHRVQDRLQERDKRKVRDNSAKWLLTRIAKCGVCGESLAVRMSRGQKAYQCVAPGCYKVAMEVQKFTAYVEQGLVRWLQSPAAASAFRANDELREQAESARRLHDQLVAQLAEARAAAATMDENGRPQLSVMSLAAIESQLTPQIERARANSEVVTAPPSLRGLIGVPDVDERWDAMLLPQQRIVLRTVVNVALNCARKRGVRAIEPGRITMTFVGQPGFKG